MNLQTWIDMFNSNDRKIVEWTCLNSAIMTPYYYRKKPADDVLVKEIHDFNQFAIEKMGNPVYDEGVPPLQCGLGEVDRYMVDRGRARWYR